MRWLLDQGLPLSAAVLLQESGEEAIHVASFGMSSASDAQILEYAFQNECIVVTLDADFHALLAHSSVSKPSVIRLREEGLKAPQVRDLVLAIKRQFLQQLQHGCVVTCQQNTLRLRKLPLTQSKG